MKKGLLIGGMALAMGLVLTSCASYRAVALSNLEPTVQVGNRSSNDGVRIAAKAFTKADCKRYLDRDVLLEGYQPVQLYIQNNFDKRTFLFAPDRVSLTCASAEEVAEKVHTSTVGRATAYGVGALFLWPLAVPAIVDGVQSSQANSALDADFASKVAGNQVIFPHGRFNKIIFVPVRDYQPLFSVVLMDADSGEPMSLKVVAS